MDEAMSDWDPGVLERLTIFARLVAQAEAAGVEAEDAAEAIYPDVYPEQEQREERVR